MDDLEKRRGAMNGMGWGRDEGGRRSISSPWSLAFVVVLGGLLATGPALVGPQPLQGQFHSEARTTQSSTPRVFLDCQTRRNCDFDHFRTEIRFVSWVRDRADADVHVIFTTTGAGGGGMQYSMDFIGLREMRGLDDELTYVSHGSDVEAEVLDGLTETLRWGLLRYALQSGQGRNFSLAYRGPVNGENSSGNGDENGQDPFFDPWDNWTFRVGLSGNMDLREARTNSRLNPSFGADRVTASWKVNGSVWGNMRRDRRELSDGTEVNNDVNSWRVNALVVRSVSNHISVGFDAGGGNSVQDNQRGRLRLAPAMEYNYFPYEEATRRQFIAHYQVGVEHSEYYQETIFGVTEETVPMHQFAVQYRAREQWGNAGVGVQTSQYLHGSGLYNVGIGGEVSYRVARGLELSVSADASWVNDNIHTPAEDIPDEDILLGRQSLPSSYRYQASLGFNYRFGSSLANVVNNRFPRFVR
jgi:hypothetical protein